MSDHSDHDRIEIEIDRTGLTSDPFASAVRATRMPMLITDPAQTDNPIVFVNDAFCTFTGYARDEILQRNCRFLQGPNTDPAAVERVKGAVRDRVPIEIDLLNYKKDGEEFWNRLLVSPVFDGDGALTYYFASQYDVTFRYRDQEALREKSDEFVALADNVNQLAWMAAPNGEIYWYNRRWYQYTGTTLESMRGWGWREVHMPDRIDRIIEEVGERWAAGRAWEGVYYLRSATGEFRPFLTRAEPIRDASGKLVRWFGTNTDISRQHEDERRLREVNTSLEESRRNLDALVRSSSEVRFSVNADWTALRQLSGGDFLRDSTTTNPDWLQDYVPAADHPAIRTEIERAIRTKSTYHIEHLVNRADGTMGWALSRAVPLFDEAGDVLEWFGAASDITARRQAEIALRTMNETLEQRVAEGLAKRGSAEEQLRQSQKLEVVGQLTGGVAHDFNNLLTVIKSSTDLLKRPDLPEERRARYVAAISDTVDRAAKLTAQLLAFARRQALKPEVFATSESVRALSDMVTTLTGSRIRIATRLPDDACFVCADPSQFDTALVNMAVNARDAMGGEGDLTISVTPVEVMPAVRAHPAVEGAFVAVAISDTGTGIPEDRLDHVFEPFFTTKEVGQGTGLGLSQVFGFAKQSGGEVLVESEVGRGTTFTLYLPRVAEGRRSVAASEPEPLVDGHGTCVLVVEDNAEVGSFAVQSLGDLGYVTVLASNAEEALAELSVDAERFDVVFSDVVMPGMNGIDLAHEIRRRHHDLPVLLASGYSHVLAQNGTYGFELLHKPYSVEELSRLLRKVTAWQRRKRIVGS